MTLPKLPIKVIPYAEYLKLANLFREAVSHLDWCGYGDQFESECARKDKLPQRLFAMQTRVDKILEVNGE